VRYNSTVNNREFEMKIFTLILGIIWIAAAIGWVINLVHVVTFFIGVVWPFEVTGMLILQCVGVFFAPLGAFLGLFF
jgi:hypothetical protein